MIENTVHLEKHTWQDTKNIIKHSKNIIDLIEEGDYVNGSRVDHIDYNFGQKIIYTEIISSKGLIDEDIKAILTHEQYSQNCFRLEDRQ